jgi:hypothetical protein
MVNLELLRAAVGAAPPRPQRPRFENLHRGPGDLGKTLAPDEPRPSPGARRERVSTYILKGAAGYYSKDVRVSRKSEIARNARPVITLKGSDNWQSAAAWIKLLKRCSA